MAWNILLAWVLLGCGGLGLLVWAVRFAILAGRYSSASQQSDELAAYGIGREIVPVLKSTVAAEAAAAELARAEAAKPRCPSGGKSITAIMLLHARLTALGKHEQASHVLALASDVLLDPQVCEGKEGDSNGQ